MPAARVSATERSLPSPLESQLRPPSRRGALLERPELLRKLDTFTERNLTLLSAPSGYGKTSLLATWTTSTPAPVAWLTLEASESNGARFLAHLADAVENARPGAGRRAASLLRARGAAPEVALHELLTDLGFAAPLAVVLEDLHVLEDRRCFELLSYAVEHLPSGVRILATTRADPPLPLGRLRARGLLGEIRARDLAFTAAEVRAVLARVGDLELDEEELRALVDRTESWPVAVYLTALWLREQHEPRLLLDGLAAGRSYVGEFLTQEVLGSLDRKTRSFLVRTSVLTYLSAPLCDAVLEGDDSDRLLEEISHSNLLITKLERDGDWFQLHRLFRELLRLELDQEEPSATRGLHRRAAVWLREHGFLVGAVAHAVAAGEDELAAEVVSESSESLLARGDAELLLRLVEQLPFDLVLARPELAAGSALATTLARRPRQERERWLAIVTRSRRTSPATWSTRAGIVASLAPALAVDGDVAAAAAQARRVLRLGARSGVRDFDASARSALAFALYLGGSDEDATAHASRALAAAHPAEHPNAVARALGVLALVAADAGRLDEAGAILAKTLELAREQGLSAATSLHVAHLARSRVLLANGETRSAEAAASLGERLCRGPDPSAPHALALLVLAETRIRNGLLRLAASTLEQAKHEIDTFADAGRLRRRLAGMRRLHTQARKSHATGAERLSPAEIAVLRLLATGLSQRSIGRELFVSVNTIKTHSRSIYRKLGVASRAAAVARANALDLIPRT
jgi:ATP/maltotriose-dependent transcriptional regulator MalT